MTIKQQTLERAIAYLNAVGATYAIIDKEGNKYGTLDVAEKKKRPIKYPFGALSKYAKEFLEPISVGEVVCIPPGPFDLEEVRSASVSWAGYNWGAGSITTSVNKNLGLVEILRVS